MLELYPYMLSSRYKRNIGSLESAGSWLKTESPLMASSCAHDLSTLGAVHFIKKSPSILDAFATMVCTRKRQVPFLVAFCLWSGVPESLGRPWPIDFTVNLLETKRSAATELGFLSLIAVPHQAALRSNQLTGEHCEHVDIEEVKFVRLLVVLG